MQSLRPIRHFIWDFDGTLFDTYPVIIRNLRHALGEFGCDADPVEAMGLMLDSIPVARRHYAQRFGLDEAALAAAYQRYHEQANAALEATPMAGLPDVLRAVAASGRYHYIFTHRQPDETNAYLEKYGLTGLFRDIVAPGGTGFAPKPAPDAVLYLMKKYGMTAADTVMIGDREIDLGSGRNAGIKTVHIVCTAVPETLDCDWRFTDYGQMLEAL